MNGVRIKLYDVSLIDFRHVLYDDSAGSVHPVRREECVCATQANDSFKNVPKKAQGSDKMQSNDGCEGLPS